MADNNQPDPNRVALSVIGGGCGVIGVTFGWIAWLPVLVVLFFSVLVGVPFYFLTTGRQRRMVPAGALQAGHALWMVLGAVLLAMGAVPELRNTLDFYVFLEFGLYLALAILLILLPRMLMVIVLTVYQTGYFILNLITLSAGNLPPGFKSSLILHLFLRILGVLMMYIAFLHKEDGEGEHVADNRGGASNADEKPDIIPDIALQPSKGASAGLILGLTFGGFFLFAIILAGVILALSGAFQNNNDLARGKVELPRAQPPPPVQRLLPANPPPIKMPAPPVADPWQSVQGPGFTVSMPRKPEVTAKTATNTNKTMHFFTTKDALASYTVMAFDPSQPRKPVQLLQILKSLRSEFPLGQIGPEMPMQSFGYQGWELTINFVDLKIVRRILFGQGREFALTVTSPQFPAIANDAHSFFASFKPLDFVVPAGSSKLKKSQQENAKILAGIKGQILSLVFMPDGKAVQAVSFLGEIYAWNLDSAETIRQFTVKDPRLRMLAFRQSPSGAVAAYSALSGRFNLLDALNNDVKPVLIDRLSPEIVGSIIFSPDDKFIGTGHGDNTLQLWNVAEQKRQWVQRCPDQVNTVTFTADGKILAAGTHKATVYLHDVDTGALLETLHATEGAAPALGAVFALACSPDTKLLAGGGYDQFIRLWSLESRREIRSPLVLNEPVRSLVFSPDGKFMAAGDQAGNVFLWDLERNFRRASFPAVSEGHAVHALSFSPNSTTLAVGWMNKIYLWDLEKVRWDDAQDGKK
jgi:WD domain, G-beta repeat